jgi:hypothetical protein
VSPAQLSTVALLASSFRDAILRANRSKLLPTLRDFPSGACGDASLLLAQFLHESGFGTALYVRGLRDRYSHAWLELAGVIVDITADQFAADPEAVLVLGEPPLTASGVIVTTDHTWHSQFEDVHTHDASINIYDNATNELLFEAYRQILSRF